MVGKTHKTLERNILDPLIQLNRGSADVRYNRGTGEFFFFGRKIDIVGASDERAQEKIRGSTLAGAYGDELSLWPESFFKMLLSRLSIPGAQFFGTTNPDSPYHWLKADYLDRKHELDLASWHFILEDNQTLDPTYVTNLKKEYTGLWYKRFILGLWVLAEGAIYDMWSEDKYLVEVNKTLAAQQRGRFKRYFAAIDYGTNNPCAFGLFGHNGGLPCHMAKEYYFDGGKAGRQKTDSEYADDFTAWHGELKPSPVYVDPSALSFITELKKRGYNVIAADNDVLDGIRFVAQLLVGGKFFVDQSCTNTIKEFAAYVWDEKAQQRGEDKPLKEHDHCMDMIRYGLFTHFFTAAPTKYIGFNYQ